jgi:hypothetical protein
MALLAEEWNRPWCRFWCVELGREERQARDHFSVHLFQIYDEIDK